MIKSILCITVFLAIIVAGAFAINFQHPYYGMVRSILAMVVGVIPIVLFIVCLVVVFLIGKDDRDYHI